MKLLADLHTHSKYSGPFHAKDKIEQMAYAANEQGLVEVAITDHGYNHWCGTSLYKIAKARLEIDEINKWSKTKVLLGVEADIISEDGKLDIDEDTLQIIDILVVGYHRLIKTDFANYFGGNSFYPCDYFLLLCTFYAMDQCRSKWCTCIIDSTLLDAYP